MNRAFFRCFIPAAALATIALPPRDALALGPLDLEIGAKAGVGTMPSNEKAPNPLGFGIGGRAGVAIAGFYGGLSAVYYVGETESAAAAGLTADLSKHALLLGVEGGYGWKLLDILTIRPQIGVGQITLWDSGNLGAGPSASGKSSANTNALYLEPGVTGMVSLGTFFVGADANALVLPSINDPIIGQSHTDVAFTLHGQVGVKF